MVDDNITKKIQMGGHMSSKSMTFKQAAALLKEMEGKGLPADQIKTLDEGLGYEDYKISFRWRVKIFAGNCLLTIFFIIVSWFQLLTVPDTKYYTTDMHGNIHEVFPQDKR